MNKFDVEKKKFFHRIRTTICNFRRRNVGNPVIFRGKWAFVSFFRNIYSICSNFNELSALDELLSVKNSLLSVIGFLPAFRLHLKLIYVFYWWIFAVSTSKFEPYASWCLEFLFSSLWNNFGSNFPILLPSVFINVVRVLFTVQKLLTSKKKSNCTLEEL